MTKKQLLQILAEKIQIGVDKKICEQAGLKNVENHISPDQKQQLAAASFLMMAHRLVAQSAEKAVESYSDYTIEGFSQKFDEEPTRQMLEETLMEIAQEYDIIQHITSPYAKLALLWSNAGLLSLRKKRQIINVEEMESQEFS